MLNERLNSLLKARYSDVQNNDTDVLYTKVLIHDDPILRTKAFLELIKTSFYDQELPPLPPQSGAYDVSQSLASGSDDKLIEDFKNGRNASPNFGTDSKTFDLLSYEDDNVSPFMIKQYHKFVGNFTDDWQRYLRRDDGRFVGLKSGKFDHRKAYRSELSPNIFYKDVAVIRESDLKVFMFVDVSGSTIRDLKNSAKVDFSLYDSKSIEEMLYRKGQSSRTNARDVLPHRHFEQDSSSSYYTTALGVAIANVLELGGCSLDFNFFCQHNIHIANPIFNEKYLPKFFSCLERDGGGGTDLRESIQYLSRALSYTPNKDKLMLVITDGSISHLEDFISVSTTLNAYYGIKFLFVGIGIHVPKEVYSIPNFELLSYTTGIDMVNRFPSDFSSFVRKKYFEEE